MEGRAVAHLNRTSRRGAGRGRRPDRGVATLRSARPADDGFLRAVYASTREEELVEAGWPAEARDSFVRMQYELQDTSFRLHHPAAERWVVLLGEQRIGRLYLDTAADAIHVLDVSLLPAHRGQGIGGRLLRDVVDRAKASGRVVRLQVEAGNPARRLYRRLGFVELDVPDDEVYVHLEHR